ncbi:MAG: hypothetical protein HC837_02170 [Chloroflexaceae bacterium]|nr:hypothetical protein [Chloroflexaceae bacterium]
MASRRRLGQQLATRLTERLQVSTGATAPEVFLERLVREYRLSRQETAQSSQPAVEP